MGRYYALHDGEAPAVADAIEQHYWPRFAGDALPEAPVAQAVALADKLETLAGLFGIGALPTGDKDPFGLRRAALGVLRILIEKRLALPLHDAARTRVPGVRSRRRRSKRGTRRARRFPVRAPARPPARAGLHGEPGRGGARAAAAAHRPRARPARGGARRSRRCRKRPRCRRANKRIVNILRKSGGEAAPASTSSGSTDGAERDLWHAFETLAPDVERHCASGDYTGALKALAAAKPAVDRFFDDVMVMADDAALRANRLALLVASRDDEPRRRHLQARGLTRRRAHRRHGPVRIRRRRADAALRSSSCSTATASSTTTATSSSSRRTNGGRSPAASRRSRGSTTPAIASSSRRTSRASGAACSISRR